MAYRYRTESVFLEEKMFGRTGAHDTRAISALSDRFNQLAADGWELFHIAEVDVVGRVFRASQRRGVTVAFFRKAESEEV